MTDTTIEKIHHHIRQNIPGAAMRRALESTDRFKEDFAAKTLDMLQTVMDVEDEWEGVVFISDDEAESLITVGDLEQLVQAKIENPDEQAA